MDIVKQFGTDERLELDGVWVKLALDAEIKIARRGNPRFRELLQRKLAPYRQAAANHAVPEEDYERILLEVASETLVLDWKGITEQKQPVPYSPVTALRYLRDLKEFRNFVLTTAENVELYKAQQDEAAEKN